MDGNKMFRVTIEGENDNRSDFLCEFAIMNGSHRFSRLNRVGVPSMFSGISEDALNRQADDGQERERRLYGSSPENVEEGGKQKGGGDGYQRQKDNQAEQRRDGSYQQPEVVVCEEDVVKTPKSSSSGLQTLGFGGSRILRKSPVKCPAFCMKEKEHHRMEYGEGSRGSPEDTRFHAEENPEKCLTPLKSFSVSSTRGPFQPVHSEEKACKCTESATSFKKSSKRKRHQRIQKGEKPDKRQNRGNNFILCLNCLLRRQRIHAAVKRFECKECGKKFRQRSSRRVHQHINSREKRYLCEYCGKQSSCFNQHIIHQRSHVGKDPYPEECGRNFTDMPDIRKHLRIHTREKLYKCGRCEESFFHMKDLGEHITIHSQENPYKCGRCEESFFHMKDLGEHITIHSQENPYKCEECGESYRCRAQRMRHRQIHINFLNYTSLSL